MSSTYGPRGPALLRMPRAMERSFRAASAGAARRRLAPARGRVTWIARPARSKACPFASRCHQCLTIDDTGQARSTVQYTFRGRRTCPAGGPFPTVMHGQRRRRVGRRARQTRCLPTFPCSSQRQH
jgi:hypothetical protein